MPDDNVPRPLLPKIDWEQLDRLLTRARAARERSRELIRRSQAARH